MSFLLLQPHCTRYLLNLIPLSVRVFQYIYFLFSFFSKYCIASLINFKYLEGALQIDIDNSLGIFWCLLYMEVAHYWNFFYSLCFLCSISTYIMVGNDICCSENLTQTINVVTLFSQISHMFRCARIQGLDTIEGLLLFGREHFYIVDGFTLLKSREIRDIASLPEGSHEPIVPSTSPRTSQEQHLCSKFHYDEIREVHQRR